VRNPDGHHVRTAGFLPGTGTKAQLGEREFGASISSFNSGASLADRQMYLDTVTGPESTPGPSCWTQIQTRADGEPRPRAPNVQPTTVRTPVTAPAGLLRDAELNLNSELKASPNSLGAAREGRSHSRTAALLAGALLIASW